MILGFDTATSATAVALMGADGEAIEVRDDPPAGGRPNHASRLLGLVEEALALAGAGWPEVERLAVGIGPGGFTGLRIGIATARALAQAHGLPAAGVSSLAALACGAAGRGRLVLPVIDARRGEVFAAAHADGREASMPPAVLTPEALVARVRRLPERPLAVGDGAVRFRSHLESAGAEVPPDHSPQHRIGAAHVCSLGARAKPVAADGLLPLYLRDPDAVPRPR